MFYDGPHQELADAAAAAAGRDGWTLRIQGIPLPSADEGGSQKESVRDITMPYWPVGEDDVAYIHHSSGTSSGMPKPVPQTHHGAAATLPWFRDASDSASFTTTPLYHGGVVDCLRAWSSGAMIWLFPGQDVPITATNVQKCLEVASSAASNKVSTCPKVRYFSSVPYILQMMAAEESGREALKSMDIVGVGGAALPAAVGDSLVEDGVRLISRFGNVECGCERTPTDHEGAEAEWY
jgi:acyl-coenzyme A synthetase/AMP-(fatty) acid ligase